MEKLLTQDLDPSRCCDEKSVPQIEDIIAEGILHWVCVLLHWTLLLEMSYFELRRRVSWVTFIETKSVLLKQPYSWSRAVWEVVACFIFFLVKFSSYSQSKLTLISVLPSACLAYQRESGKGWCLRGAPLPCHACKAMLSTCFKLSLWVNFKEELHSIAVHSPDSLHSCCQPLTTPILLDDSKM